MVNLDERTEEREGRDHNLKESEFPLEKSEQSGVLISSSSVAYRKRLSDSRNGLIIFTIILLFAVFGASLLVKGDSIPLFIPILFLLPIAEHVYSAYFKKHELYITAEYITFSRGRNDTIIQTKDIKGIGLAKSQGDTYSLVLHNNKRIDLNFPERSEEIFQALKEVAGLKPLWNTSEPSSSVREPKAKEVNKQDRSW
ncbi:MAG: hypothetical protein KDC26_00435 [Armatimonadetes bacterium]|nr:hypothetical protein [Armatimonadota bacterium]